jgi:dGTPase
VAEKEAVPVTLNRRVDIEAAERKHLAGYAALAAQSRGRVYPQEEHPFRTAFQRDRDRIVHCSAFRRMEYKTQVFLPREGDHFRTRLTHTIEVAQIGRTLARCLGVNEDLTEAIALAHDLGHTPFGHCGEDVLAELLADNGGFNHNRQSLRVIDVLEERYPDYPGLNLSYEVREGIVKHETKTPISLEGFEPEQHPTLEASLVDIADEIAYNGHDVDDAVNARLISLDSVKELAIWSQAAEGRGAGSDSGSVFASLTEDQKRHAAVRYLVNTMATDVLQETPRRIDKLGITDLDSLRRAPQKACSYSDAMADRVSELKGFLKREVYRHPSLQQMASRAREIITTLFERLRKDPSRMPDRFRKMLEKEAPEIVIADYIAGMTDRYAEGLYSNGLEGCR